MSRSSAIGYERFDRSDTSFPYGNRSHTNDGEIQKSATSARKDGQVFRHRRFWNLFCRGVSWIGLQAGPARWSHSEFWRHLHRLSHRIVCDGQIWVLDRSTLLGRSNDHPLFSDLQFSFHPASIGNAECRQGGAVCFGNNSLGFQNGCDTVPLRTCLWAQVCRPLRNP